MRQRELKMNFELALLMPEIRQGNDDLDTSLQVSVDLFVF